MPRGYFRLDVAYLGHLARTLIGRIRYHKVIGALAHQPYESDTGCELLAPQPQTEVIRTRVLRQETLELFEKRCLSFNTTNKGSFRLRL